MTVSSNGVALSSSITSFSTAAAATAVPAKARTSPSTSDGPRPSECACSGAGAMSCSPSIRLPNNSSAAVRTSGRLPTTSTRKAAFVTLVALAISSCTIAKKLSARHNAESNAASTSPSPSGSSSVSASPPSTAAISPIRVARNASRPSCSRRPTTEEGEPFCGSSRASSSSASQAADSKTNTRLSASQACCTASQRSELSSTNR
mmetsp:Transcript_76623/g.212929  ORF Transcript_76623/g.212929 Transcript_76623/m.212929 type:complete len:205 (+) Transcript_76623:335-949(+)